MYPPGGGRQPEIDFEQISARFRNTFGGVTRRLGGGGIGLLIIAIIALIVVIWAARGIYTISPGEQAALRLFGSLQTIETATGLHWWWPSPFGKRDVVLVTETRRMELGFRETEGGAVTPVLQEALMISGDLNIVDVQMAVQYNISNLENFLFRVQDPGEEARGIGTGRPDGRTLKDASEAALRLVVGQRSIDDVLTERREEVEAETQAKLQEILNNYNTGINIINVRLQDVKPPEQVRDAFDDVLRARQERETKINLAQAYQNEVIPRAQGDAARMIEEARAFRQEQIEGATGEAARFISILTEYENSRDVTRQRLYLEAMEEILPGITKVIVSPEVESVLILGGDGTVTPVPVEPALPGGQ